jgi:hypothetical protein
MGKHAQKGEMQNSRKKRNKASRATATAKIKPSQAEQPASVRRSERGKTKSLRVVRTELCQL